MKGRQYHGRIYPGPTALILGTQMMPPVGKSSAASSNDAGTNSNNNKNNTKSNPQVKVLGMTDEFARCLRQEGHALDAGK